jgi:hypothetical protein
MLFILCDLCDLLWQFIFRFAARRVGDDPVFLIFIMAQAHGQMLSMSKTLKRGQSRN